MVNIIKSLASNQKKQGGTGSSLSSLFLPVLEGTKDKKMQHHFLMLAESTHASLYIGKFSGTTSPSPHLSEVQHHKH
jgi:hypothetical protein